MSDIQLGLLIEGEAHRDAIHIAVAPVSSDEQLQPGQRVALVEGTCDRVKASNHATVGIVDPFLRMPVQPSQRFWLCLYVKTVTSLRHEWTHPAFKEETKQDASYSIQWIKDYVIKHCPYDENQPDKGYSDFISNVINRQIYYHGSDCHSLGDVEDSSELFKHLSIVMMRRIDSEYFSGGFTCSC